VAVRWPQGFRSSGVACGIKAAGAADLGLFVATEPIAWAGVFTNNAAAAAPVRWCRAALGTPARAVLVNSGNANACTGDSGVRAVRDSAAATASALGCAPGEVLVASTGPIGLRLPVDRIVSSIPTAISELADDVLPFAGSILTTDTAAKVATAEIERASIVGVAKGAAMVAPNMATMLAFVATDAALPQDPLQRALRAAAGATFNQISIDACESTNDSVFLLSSGTGPAVELDAFREALRGVCESLAEQIVRDAEGATKLLRIHVSGAPDTDAAARHGRAVAASDLWRAAAHGADPNWGRIVAALGSADRGLDIASTTVRIAGTTLFDRGEPVADPAPVAAAMAADEVTVDVTVGEGPGGAVILASDLTPDYVKLNAERTT
jgi:glutamate N-acetyltransferase / amino-acid N-acetyltransferase